MDFQTWEPIYERILADFDYSRQADEQAASILHSLVDEPASPDLLKERIAGKDATVCGAAETLEHEVTDATAIVIAADEATSTLLRYNIQPDVIVTDLDGDVTDQVHASQQGSITVIHAHGDNIEALRRYAPCFTGPVVLTTQATPFDDVYNFGGFTDGDRAYFLARECNAASITLLGFDFDHPRYKPGKDRAIKHKKLQWARRLIAQY
ncbi:MAG: 6-hydroxymethylpterin diphosphokinase MptE-like protein [Thermoplasmatota archaeon]